MYLATCCNDLCLFVYRLGYLELEDVVLTQKALISRVQKHYTQEVDFCLCVYVCVRLCVCVCSCMLAYGRAQVCAYTHPCMNSYIVLIASVPICACV